MSSTLKFLARRLSFMVFTFILITALLYGILMLSPVEARAMLFVPKGERGNSFNFIQNLIREKRLDDPYPIQYLRWLANISRGDWGYSPSMRDDVLPAMLRRTPVTAELTLFSVLMFVPLGLIHGVVAGSRQGRFLDFGFRLLAFIATSIPPFILGLLLLSIFYVGLRWFPIGRLNVANDLIVSSPSFKSFTGLLTIDGLLNGQPSITVDALRHLILPSFTLSLAHWATLGRITRATMIEELDKGYIVAAHARGLTRHRILWRHALRNALPSSLNSIALSAASLVTGVFVIEVIFSLPGVSQPLNSSTTFVGSLVPDVPATMGFAVYGILLVLPLMLILDVIQVLINPLLREEVLG